MLRQVRHRAIMNVAGTDSASRADGPETHHRSGDVKRLLCGVRSLIWFPRQMPPTGVLGRLGHRPHSLVRKQMFTKVITKAVVATATAAVLLVPTAGTVAPSITTVACQYNDTVATTTNIDVDKPIMRR